MQKIFESPAILEQKAKELYSIPPFLMMENAARSMADFIKALNPRPENAFIFCGKGNNGADGLALARLLQADFHVSVYCLEPPKTPEGQIQFEMAQKLGVSISQHYETFFDDFNDDKQAVIVDCIYGTGFHGTLPESVGKLFDRINALSQNASHVIKIACDTPSGINSANGFQADYTITMGTLKTSLFTDRAKALCGKIIVAHLGIALEKLEAQENATAFLITNEDAKLPLRTDKSAHKGTYGHTVVFAGEKAGAGIISASAAMNFGSGLISLYQTEKSNLARFKIIPELMICNELPAKTSAVILGPGLGKITQTELSDFLSWFSTNKNPSCVLDADIFYYDDISLLLENLNSHKNPRIALTPHLKELQALLKALNFPLEYTDCTLEKIDRIKIGKLFTQKFSNCTLVMKSAVTYIAHKGEIYICNDGTQSLAKGGSGDVLAGMIGSLLAQGYDSKNAAITAVESHAKLSQLIGEKSYNLTPQKLIRYLGKL